MGRRSSSRQSPAYGSLRTTRRSRGGAARGGGTPSSTSKAGWSGSGRQSRTFLGGGGGGKVSQADMLHICSKYIKKARQRPGARSREPPPPASARSRTDSKAAVPRRRRRGRGVAPQGGLGMARRSKRREIPSTKKASPCLLPRPCNAPAPHHSTAAAAAAAPPRLRSCPRRPCPAASPSPMTWTHLLVRPTHRNLAGSLRSAPVFCRQWLFPEF